MAAGGMIVQTGKKGYVLLNAKTAADATGIFWSNGSPNESKGCHAIATTTSTRDRQRRQH